MTQAQTTLSASRNVSELVTHIEKLTQEIQELYCLDDVPWVVGYSGGKDSTAVLQLIWKALKSLPEEKRTKKIYVITTDTLVENPIVSSWVNNSLEQMRLSAEKQNLPIEPHLLIPELKYMFWTNLIGKGYPSPRRGFRWCTERLKIRPTNSFIRNVIRVSGKVLLILGTRKAESKTRAATMARYEATKVDDLLNSDSNLSNYLRYSDTLPEALIYSPIQEWRDDEVWLYLMQYENAWGYSNQDLFTMYRGATEDNECPLVVDTSTPSCGDSRFGCWVCTMVDKDKSMEAMIQNDEEKEWLQPLLDIRNELDVQKDDDRRDFRRLWGNVQLFERKSKGKKSIVPVPGPYLKEWREYWLRKVLEAQVQVRQNAPEEFKDISLITPEELSEIRRIWLEEKHEFDDSLPKIYEEVTGEVFCDMRKGVNENKILGEDEWDILQEICDDDVMHLELMTKLLDTERQFYTKSRRVGIYESLTKCFDSSSRSKDEAIEKAHQKRDLMTAAMEGDVKQVKEKIAKLNKKESKQTQQLTWGNIKFTNKENDTKD
ncbi:Sulfurtransferase DndC [Hyella patelloides LEGE 07179]|uniref:Sulfurtransferase DndC n=1 Tax=Hyella patelloides LEGE 07179 TaxID=945734 RepID=A0A563W4R2_9CYAN|nr:DNA phosphorothioation system sulfurtransferase DndC [Hyella patelloides]VEP18689.1 Sulfurtransferase DndC [Hyella patelloides LEGE 07179]